MLSSFAYNTTLNFIDNKAYKEGVEVHKVNPAFTSIIGRVKFADKYGLSSHLAAAFVIARRSCNYSEKFPSCLKLDNKNSKSAFFYLLGIKKNTFGVFIRNLVR